jgi:endoribonuclease LACTB2
MFRVTHDNRVQCLRMSRTIFKRNIRVSCSYVVDGLCVDTGPAVLKSPFARYMQENPPKQAFFTHSHEDHAGNIDVLNHLGIVPHVHKESLAILSSPPRIPFYRRLVWGDPARGQGQEAEGTITTERYTFQVIPSPGHSRDHQCLYEQDMGWLFSGDAYLGERSIYLHAEEEMDHLLETLKRLSALDFGTIFCGHRGIVQRGPDAFRQKLSYLQNLQEDARHLARQGWTEKAIMTRLLGKEDMMCYLSRGEFSKSHLIRSLLDNQENN